MIALMRAEALRLGRYGLVGGAATLLHGAVALLALHAGAPPLPANLAGFLSGFALAATGHVFWTFRLANDRLSAVARFFLASLAALAASSLALRGVLLIAPEAERIAILTGALIAPATSYLLARFWAFRNRGEKA